MHLKLIFIFSLFITGTSCRENSRETSLDDVKSEELEQSEELYEQKESDSDLRQLIKSGMTIKEVRGILSQIEVKKKTLKNKDLMRVYFFHEQENFGDLLALDLHLDDGLVTACNFGYRKN
jgi:hypothetical protein